MIYFFYGDEEFNISNQIREMKKKLDPNFIEMSFKTLNNPNYADFVAALRSQPMMFGKMLIVIDCLNFLCPKTSQDKSLEDSQLNQITQALEGASENVDIVLKAVIAPDSQKKIDKRKKLFKIFSKYNAKEFLQIPSYKTAELESWIKRQAAEKKLKMSNEVISAFLLQVGSNLRMLDTELEKLKTYSRDSAVTVDMIKEICVSNEHLFEFADLLALENKTKALLEYQKLLVKKHPLEILSVLHTLLHNKIYIKANASKYGADEIARLINIHPYRVKLEMQKLKNVSLKRLVELKKNITNAEYLIKSGQSNLDVDKEFEYALLQ